MMLKKMPGYTLTAVMAVIFACFLLSGPLHAKDKDKLPEVDSDGLHLVKKSKVRAAYQKPGTDLSTYSKVKLLDCYVDFVKNWEHDYNLNQIGLNGRIRDKDAEAIKTRLAAEFTKEFTKVLTEKGIPVVDEVGADVLLLRPALINVDVTAPDVMTAGIQTTIISSAGDMTLYMEMYDSATSTLIARVVDPQADNEAFAQRANRVTNKAAADRMLRYWAGLLVTHLQEAKK
ncbi:MAG: DUF3313 family protein [Sedimenticolaceae bacterium]